MSNKRSVFSRIDKMEKTVSPNDPPSYQRINPNDDGETYDLGPMLQPPTSKKAARDLKKTDTTGRYKAGYRLIIEQEDPEEEARIMAHVEKFMEEKESESRHQEILEETKKANLPFKKIK